MKKLYPAIITGFLLLFFAGEVFGQQTLVNDAHKRALAAIVAKKTSEYQQSHQKALALAKSHNWPVRKITKNGGVISLQGIDSRGFPVYHRTSDNIISAATTRTNTVNPGGILGLTLSGSSTFLDNKLAEWDGGAVYAAHQEFKGKTITINTNQGIVEHSTHVAGTMIAKGVYPPAKGMAYNAATLLSYDFDNDLMTIASAAPNLLLSNHSYGDEAGWLLDETGTVWTWYGMPGDTVDGTFGIYDSYAQSFDQIAYNAPYYLIVAAAANSRGYPGPDIGGTYYGYTSATNTTLILKTHTATDGISNQQWYDGITPPATAKNVLAVGAVNPLPYGPANNAAISIAYFSAWGPADDGRVKPDICGNGVNVLSTGIADPKNYVVLDGTSMASPNVTGSLYLLQEYWAKRHAGAFMLASTLKGLACATADDAGNPGPDYIYGWGLLDMEKAANAITYNGSKSIIKEDTLLQGQTRTTAVTASGNGPLTATIAWTDPEGTAVADGTINNRTPTLVNDLDIRVSDGTTTFMPWVLDPLNPQKPATTGDNIVDNIEQVYLGNATPGKKYTITVSHKGTLQSGSQAFSTIVTGVGGSVYCTSGPTSSADSRVNNFTLSNINNTQTTGCTTFSDYTNLTDTLEQGKTYPLSITLGTCGANFNKAAKVYVDWKGDGTFTDAGDLIATSNVINGTGTYTTNITVPLTVVPGNYSILRVVCTETSDTSTITPCGAYAKGETQDYRVLFTKTSTDAGITAITSPDTAGACAGVIPITVTIKNYGSASISNVPVTVSITAPDNTVTTYNETYPGTLVPLDEESYTFNGTFTAAASSTYIITAATNLANDVIPSNNAVTDTIKTNAAPVLSALSANYCTETSEYLLSGSGDGEVLWYPAANSTDPIAVGAPVETATAPVSNTYYAGLNDFSGTIGPANKEVFTGGGYNQFGPTVNVTATAPVILQSARLYVGNSGSVTFAVTNADGETLSSTTLNLVATSSTPVQGAQADNPSDTGKVYTLNLLIPAAGNYIITTTYNDTATLYRNNAGVTGYPFTTGGGIFSITGNSAADTYYYYFYNMIVKSAGCASAARVPVVLKRPVATLSGSVFTSNFDTGNQWYEDGNAISGATGQTYTAVTDGRYQLRVTFDTGCTDTSASVVYVSPSNAGKDAIGLTIYPVPADNVLNVLFNAPTSAALNLQLVNSVGEITYTNKQSISAGNFSTTLDISTQPAGVYVVKIILGTKIYAQKIVIVK
jgi:hypothetical protein